MSNRLNRPRAQRAIASFFLALVLLGAVVGLVRDLHGANAAPHLSRPDVTQPAPSRHGTPRPAGEPR